MLLTYKENVHSTQMYIPLKPLFSRHKGIGVQFTDEPTSALDVIAQRQVVDIFKDIKCSGDTSMIIVSHNINVVRELADKIIVMKSGRIVEYEDTEIIMNYPKQEYTKQLISAVPVLRRECADEYNIRA